MRSRPTQPTNERASERLNAQTMNNNKRLDVFSLDANALIHVEEITSRWNCYAVCTCGRDHSISPIHHTHTNIRVYHFVAFECSLAQFPISFSFAPSRSIFPPPCIFCGRHTMMRQDRHCSRFCVSHNIDTCFPFPFNCMVYIDLVFFLRGFRIAILLIDMKVKNVRNPPLGKVIINLLVIKWQQCIFLSYVSDHPQNRHERFRFVSSDIRSRKKNSSFMAHVSLCNKHNVCRSLG